MKSEYNSNFNEDPLNNAKSHIELSASFKQDGNNENQPFLNADGLSLIQKDDSVSPNEVNKIELSFSYGNNDDKKVDSFQNNNNIKRDATIEFVMNINVDKDKNIPKEKNEITTFTNKNEEPYNPEILAEGKNKIPNGCNCFCVSF